MIQVSPALAAALNATANQPVDLYELYLDSGTLYYADRAVAWGGHNYLPYVRSRSAIRRFLGGEFDRVTVELANVDTAISQLLAATEIEGRTLIIRRVDLTVADDSLVLFHGRMERASRVTEDVAALTAVQLLGSIDHEAPSRKFVTFCPWKFKSDQCGYSGPESDCNKSWARCKQLANTNAYGGFRFVPHGGTYQYTEVEKKRFLLLFSRKSKKTVTATFNAVDDTPYDVPIPIILGRAQIAGIPIQHADEGGVTKVLAAFSVGTISEMKYVRANGELVADWTQHLGQVGGTASQLTDPRFPNAYPYNRVAYVGVTIPSDVRAEDPAPVVDAVILGSIVDLYDAGGNWSGSAWSDNPVWLTRHFMTLSLEEGGMGVPEALIDNAVAYQTAAYCDELVWDATNDQKIYEPSSMPEGMTVGDDYRRYRSTGVYGADPEVDGPYDTYEPGVDDDSSTAPAAIQVKRFTCNAALAKAEKAVDILYKKLLPAFRGYLTLSKEGKIQIRSERPVANSTLSASVAPGATVLPVAAAPFAVGDKVLIGALTASAEVRTVTAAGGGSITVTPAIAAGHNAGDVVHLVAMAFDDSTVCGQIEYPLSDRVPSTNRVTIKYVDAPAGFEARELQINSYEHQEKVHKVNNEDLDGSAIDNYFQAWRIGQWSLAKARDLAKFVSFKADIKASRLEVGDVIAVSAAEHGLQAVPFLVEELSFEPDDEVSILGRLYSLSIYNDTAPQATVTVPAVFQPILPGATAEAERSPLDFGGIGDGVADDTAAVQAALDNMDTVKIPAGYTFLVGDVLVQNKARCRIIGTGTLKAKDASSVNSRVLGFLNVGDVVIDGPTLDGNQATQSGTAMSALYILDCPSVVLNNVAARNAKLHGAYIRYSGSYAGATPYVSVSNSWFDGNADSGLAIHWEPAGKLANVSVTNVSTTGNVSKGYHLRNLDWVALTACSSKESIYAVFLWDSTAKFTGCDFAASSAVLNTSGTTDYTAYNCVGLADRFLVPTNAAAPTIAADTSDPASYGLTFTLPSFPANAAYVDCLVQWYTTSDGSTPDGEPMYLGSIDAGLLARTFGPFPKDAVGYCKGVVRPRNPLGVAASADTYSASVLTIPAAGINTVPTNAAAPTLTADTSDPNSYDVTISLAALPSGATYVAYGLQWYSDAGGTVADGPPMWIDSFESGKLTATHTYPKTTLSYCRAVVRPYNALSVPSAAVTTSANVITIPAAGGYTPVDATQPGSGDWSIGTLVHASDDNTRSQWLGIPITVTIPADADYVQVWQYRGAAPPASPSAYTPSGLTILKGSGAQTDTLWIEKESAAFTLQLVITASTKHSTVFPSAGTPVKSVAVPAIASAGSLTTPAVSAQTRTASGRTEARFTMSAGFSTTDENLQYIVARKRECSAGYTNPGAWEIFWYGAPGKEFPNTSPFSASQVDFWDVPTTLYIQGELGVQNYAGVVTWSGVISSFTISSDGKVDATTLKNVGTGLIITGGVLKADLGSGLSLSGNQIVANLGSGLTISGSQIVANLGDGLTISLNRIVPNLGPGLEISGSQQRVKVNGTEIVTNVGGSLEIGAITVQKLTAGTANFAGDVTFQRGGAERVTINSTGTTIKTDSYNFVSSSATGLTVRGGTVSKTTQVTLSATNLVMEYDANNKTDISSLGITLSGASKTLSLSSSGITLSDGTRQLLVNSSGITAQYDANNKTQVLSTGVVITGGGKTLTLSASALEMNQGATRLSLTSTALLMSSISPARDFCKVEATDQGCKISGIGTAGGQRVEIQSPYVTGTGMYVLGSLLSVNTPTTFYSDVYFASTIGGITPAQIGAAAASHSHAEYSLTSHNHAGIYAPASHSHGSHNHTVNSADIEVATPGGGSVWIKVLAHYAYGYWLPDGQPDTGYTTV